MEGPVRRHRPRQWGYVREGVVNPQNSLHAVALGGVTDRRSPRREIITDF